MENVVIDYGKILNAIGQEFQKVWEDLVSSSDQNVQEIISNVKSIEVSDEQYFRKQESSRTLRRGTVYLVVRFSAGSINYGSSVTPISVYGLGVANQVKPVQLLLSHFSSTWTTLNLGQGLEIEEENILQVWNTPEVISNFNVVDEDFRNLYRITGNIVVGPAAVRLGTLTYIYDEAAYNLDNSKGCEIINIMSFYDDYHASLDSQPFGSTNGFVKSEVNFSTYTFSVSTYLLTGHLAQDVLAVRGFRYRPNGEYPADVSNVDAFSKFSANQEMLLKLEFNNDYNNYPGENEQSSATDPVKGSNFYAYYKMVSSQIRQDLGAIPSLNITFTR